MAKTYTIGLVGVAPPESWAVVAHLPALRARPDRFSIAGLANSSAESSRRAAEACGIAKAFDSVEALCASDEVDMVVVTVRAALHAPIVEQALAAGKHVYCEWPLGCDYQETRRLAHLARDKGVLAVCGLQARAHPVLRHAAELLSQDHIGRPLFATLVADGGNWGGMIPQRYAYSLDAAQGATMLSVPVGHTLWGLGDLFGRVETVFGDCRQRRAAVRVVDTGETLPLNAPDSIIGALTFESGLPLSLHYRSGLNQTGGFRLQIVGESGQLLLEGDPFGAVEMIEMTLRAADADGDLKAVPLPDHLRPQPSQGVIPDNVMAIYDQIYADLEADTATAPTFDDALDNYRLLEALRVSSDTNRRILLGDFDPA